MIKKLFREKFIYVIIFCLSNFLMEMLVFMRLGFGFYPKYVLFNVTYMVVVSALLFMIKKRKWKLTLSIFLLTFQAVVNCFNVCYYSVLGDIFSFDLLNLGAEAAGVFEFAFLDFAGIGVFAGLLAVIIYCLVAFTTPTPKPAVKVKRPFKKVMALLLANFMIVVTLGASFGAVSVLTLKSAKADDPYYIQNSDKYLFDNFQFKRDAYRKFGSAGFYVKSLYDLIIHEKVGKKEKQELTDYINASENLVPEDTGALLYGDNLIIVMLESVEWFGINPYTTPTLYSFLTGTGEYGEDAFAFTNFRGRNKTNVSEAISILGSEVREGSLMSLSKSKNFAPSNSLAYKFKDLGYNANFYHPFDGTFYKRNRVNKKLGFDNVVALQQIDWKLCGFGNFYSELDFMNEIMGDKVLDEYKFIPEDKPFFNFYLTVGTHGPYGKENGKYLTEGVSNYSFFDENKQAITEYLEGNGYHMPSSKSSAGELRKYMGAVKDTDNAVKAMLDGLKAKGKLDDTTIVFYTDHNCYYSNLCLNVRFDSEVATQENSDIYNLPFFIYSKKLADVVGEDRSIDTFCNTYDIYPTICELFGLEYTTSLTQGYSIFNGDGTYNPDIENSFFASFLTAMFTDKLYSYNITELYVNEGDTVTDAEKEKFQILANNFFIKQEKIDKIYNNFLNKKA